MDLGVVPDAGDERRVEGSVGLVANPGSEVSDRHDQQTRRRRQSSLAGRGSRT